MFKAEQVEKTIRNELLQEVPREEIVKSYAFGLENAHIHNDKLNWRQINQAIIEVYGIKGLESIKEDAWALFKNKCNIEE